MPTPSRGGRPVFLGEAPPVRVDRDDASLAVEHGHLCRQGVQDRLAQPVALPPLALGRVLRRNVEQGGEAGAARLPLTR
jgi:hypothetical protein